MEKQLIDNIASLLRQDGFKNVTRQKSSTATTLTADRDGTNVVVHVNEGGVAATSLAVQHSLAPQGLEIAMKATLPGFKPPSGDVASDNPLRGIRQGSGGGGSPSLAGRLEQEFAKES